MDNEPATLIGSQTRSNHTNHGKTWPFNDGLMEVRSHIPIKHAINMEVNSPEIHSNDMYQQ